MSKSPRRARSGPPAPRLSQRRPVLDRLIFGVALLGLLVAAHLYIQQGRGLDRGCLGFSAPSTAVADCEVVAQSDASSLFGVSNAVWGMIFYFVVAALSFAVLLVRRERLRPLKGLRALLVAGGFLYAAYLFYVQAAVIGEFCVLCVTSAAIELALLVLVGVDFARPVSRSTTQTTDMKSPSVLREASIMGGLALVVLLLVGADFAYFNGLEEGEGLDPVTSLDLSAESVAGDAAPAADECGYDSEKEPVENYRDLVGALDPYKGNAEAPVTVIEYFDPNCPHCRTMYTILQDVMEEHGDDAMFVYKPFVLWQQSVAQSAALYAAAQEDKFFEMLELQFANQQRNGLSPEQLRAFAEHIGMNPDVLMQRIQSGIYLSTLKEVRETGSALGVNSVPALLINGRWVDSSSRTAACIGELIEEAAE